MSIDAPVRAPRRPTGPRRRAARRGRQARRRHDPRAGSRRRSSARACASSSFLCGRRGAGLCAGCRSPLRSAARRGSADRPGGPVSQAGGDGGKNPVVGVGRVAASVRPGTAPGIRPVTIGIETASEKLRHVGGGDATAGERVGIERAGMRDDDERRRPRRRQSSTSSAMASRDGSGGPNGEHRQHGERRRRAADGHPLARIEQRSRGPMISSPRTWPHRHRDQHMAAFDRGRSHGRRGGMVPAHRPIIVVSTA